MTRTIQIDRFSISFYHGVAAIVFKQGSFTIACRGGGDAKSLTEQVKQSTREARVSKFITRAEIKKIASALSHVDAGDVQ